MAPSIHQSVSSCRADARVDGRVREAPAAAADPNGRPHWPGRRELVCCACLVGVSLDPCPDWSLLSRLVWRWYGVPHRGPARARARLIWLLYTFLRAVRLLCHNKVAVLLAGTCVVWRDVRSC